MKCPTGFVKVEDRCVSEDDYFNSILAKNQLARHFKREGVSSVAWAESKLKDIEKVIGTSNQPSVENIFESDMDI